MTKSQAQLAAWNRLRRGGFGKALALKARKQLLADAEDPQEIAQLLDEVEIGDYGLDAEN